MTKSTKKERKKKIWNRETVAHLRAPQRDESFPSFSYFRIFLSYTYFSGLILYDARYVAVEYTLSSRIHRRKARNIWKSWRGEYYPSTRKVKRIAKFTKKYFRTFEQRREGSFWRIYYIRTRAKRYFFFFLLFWQRAICIPERTPVCRRHG